MLFRSLDEAEQALLRRRDLARLEVMTHYCKTEDCLRGRILDYFGQDHPPACGSCGNCQGAFRQTDITVSAQMLLSCVKRVKDQLGYYVGAGLILQVLRGSRSQRIFDLQLDQLSTYGLLRGMSQTRLREILDCLLAKGYVTIEQEHSTLRPTAAARGVLFQGEKVVMQTRVEERETRARPAAEPAADVDQDLLEALKAERTRQAQREGVPAYIVFSNATLVDMARKKPADMDELMEVSGIGAVKAQRYGAQFLAVIDAHEG